MLEKSQVFLGFDFGMKYIGVAIGQSVTCTASPVTTLVARDGIPNWNEIQALIEKWQPDGLIVGIPLKMDDSVQPVTFSARRFVKRLQGRFGLPMHTVDERLSSWEAQKRIEEAKERKIKSESDIHAISAMILVEQWISENL